MQAPEAAAPPGAVMPAGAAGAEAGAPVPPEVGSDGAPRHFVEQRVVSTDVKTRNYDDPDDDSADLTLLQVLPGSMAQALDYPLTYRLAVSSGYTGVTMRQAASAPARAAQYICLPFYKPISRCVGGGG
jgi:hypothetical protein